MHDLIIFLKQHPVVLWGSVLLIIALVSLIVSLFSSTSTSSNGDAVDYLVVFRDKIKKKRITIAFGICVKRDFCKPIFGSIGTALERFLSVDNPEVTVKHVQSRQECGNAHYSLVVNIPEFDRKYAVQIDIYKGNPATTKKPIASTGKVSFTADEIQKLTNKAIIRVFGGIVTSIAKN
jgi:hypothetical protein